MVTIKEFAWLQSLQKDLAIKRDWVTVAHLQCVMDRIVDEHPFPSEFPKPSASEIIHH